jgi:hypothetical protein
MFPVRAMCRRHARLGSWIVAPKRTSVRAALAYIGSIECRVKAPEREIEMWRRENCVARRRLPLRVLLQGLLLGQVRFGRW